MISCGLIAEALEGYEAESQAGNLEIADAQQAEVLERFPRSAWPEMAVEQYALGLSEHPDSFCRWMEFRATELGSIRGGSARKHHIYFRPKEEEWWFERDRYSSVAGAWGAVRAGFVEALGLAESGEWEAIDWIPALRGGPALLMKTLYLYFPELVLPIHSHAHLTHYVKALGGNTGTQGTLGTVALNQLLLRDLKACEELDGWSTKQIERLLYQSRFSPFVKEDSPGPIGDVAGFVAKTVAAYGDAGLEARREAEDEARALLDAKAGAMEERELREMLRLFNADSHQGKRYQTRFSPAFVGATANGLVANLEAVNEWTERLWRGADEDFSRNIATLLDDRKLLPSSGTSYPTMLLHLRQPDSFAVWLRSTDTGLQRLHPGYEPSRTPGSGGLDDYLAFCQAAKRLMEDFDIPPELLDAVLAAASRIPASDQAGPGKANVWIFQANPKVFDIDRALSEEPELNWVVRQYRKAVRKGDRIYLWRAGGEAGVIATATVLSDPEKKPGIAGSPYLLQDEALDKPEPRVDLRIDRVLGTPIRRTDLLEHPVLKDLGVIAFANATNFEVTSDQDAALRALIAEPETETASLVVPEIRSGLAAELHLPSKFLDDTVDMLVQKRQLIFYGPPGTGKTWVAMALARELTHNGGATAVVQFHPSYSYEDFVGGFRPAEDDSQAGGVRYERRDGPLRTIARQAAADPGNPYVLIVDEINRGNIPKIFGELLFLLEYRRRAVRLQYWPEDDFTLPENLFLIGTMNTADRSIALVDVALRRRFYFVEFSPTAGPVKEVLPSWLREHGLDDEAALLLERLNEEIGADEFAIGPSYFMSAGGEAPDLERIWEREIMPLLHEHFYGSGWDPARFALATLRSSLPQGNGAAPD